MDHDDVVISGTVTNFNWRKQYIELDGERYTFSTLGKASACMRWFGARHDRDMLDKFIELHVKDGEVTTFDGK